MLLGAVLGLLPAMGRPSPSHPALSFSAPWSPTSKQMTLLLLSITGFALQSNMLRSVFLSLATVCRLLTHTCPGSREGVWPRLVTQWKCRSSVTLHRIGSKSRFTPVSFLYLEIQHTCGRQRNPALWWPEATRCYCSSSCTAAPNPAVRWSYLCTGYRKWKGNLATNGDWQVAGHANRRLFFCKNQPINKTNLPTTHLKSNSVSSIFKLILV